MAVLSMFKVEKNNKKIGKYLNDLINQKYKSRRAFCEDYIITAGEEPTNEKLTNMSNRLMQIVKGTKAIQTYDLPYFTKLLNISCEQLLSAGEYPLPLINRVTNYSIAASKNPKVWEEYINRSDKLILNSDEYCKTVLDYALDFKNYEFIKYLMDNKYIWFDSRKDQDIYKTFGAGTSIERRDICSIDCGLSRKIREEDELRLNLIALAADKNDIEMLHNLRARENPQLYYRIRYRSNEMSDFNKHYNEKMVEHIASANDKVLDYFTDAFDINEDVKYSSKNETIHTFMFPYISQLLDKLIEKKSTFAESALKKAIEHNNNTFQKLQKNILTAKQNDIIYFYFYDNGDIVDFYSFNYTEKKEESIITNVPHVTKNPSSGTLSGLVLQINQSYKNIKMLTNHSEEI